MWFQSEDKHNMPKDMKEIKKVNLYILLSN